MKVLREIDRFRIESALMINIDFGFRLGNDLNGVGFSLNISILPILFHCLNQIFL